MLLMRINVFILKTFSVLLLSSMNAYTIHVTFSYTMFPTQRVVCSLFVVGGVCGRRCLCIYTSVSVFCIGGYSHLCIAVHRCCHRWTGKSRKCSWRVSDAPVRWALGISQVLTPNHVRSTPAFTYNKKSQLCELSTVGKSLEGCRRWYCGYGNTVVPYASSVPDSALQLDEVMDMPLPTLVSSIFFHKFRGGTASYKVWATSPWGPWSSHLLPRCFRPYWLAPEAALLIRLSWCMTLCVQIQLPKDSSVTLQFACNLRPVALAADIL